MRKLASDLAVTSCPFQDFCKKKQGDFEVLKSNLLEVRGVILESQFFLPDDDIDLKAV